MCGIQREADLSLLKNCSNKIVEFVCDFKIIVFILVNIFVYKLRLKHNLYDAMIALLSTINYMDRVIK